MVFKKRTKVSIANLILTCFICPSHRSGDSTICCGPHDAHLCTPTKSHNADDRPFPESNRHSSSASSINFSTSFLTIEAIHNLLGWRGRLTQCVQLAQSANTSGPFIRRSKRRTVHRSVTFTS